MISLFTLAAQYTSLTAMIILAVSIFFMLRADSSRDLSAYYRMNNVVIFLLHFVNYAVIYLNENNSKYLIFFGLQCAFFLVYFLTFRHVYKNCSLIILNIMYLLLCVGMIFLARLNYPKAQKQFYIMCASGIVSLLIPPFLTRISTAKKLSGALGVLGIMALGAVLLLSRTTYGANLSLSVAGISVQPSEFVKVTYVLLLAMLFRQRNDWKRIFFGTAVAMAHTGILVLSKDLGGALIYYLSFIFILYACTHKLRYPFLGIGILTMGAFAAYFMFSHVRVRVSAWLDPWSTINTTGYQVAQSLFSIAGGGFFGSGLYRGAPGYIPVVEKDFMFAAISEEAGAIFAFLLIVIYLYLVLEMLKVAGRCSVVFFKLLCVGLASVIAIQTFLTVGGALKFIPSTGVTLALVSYGGSSLLSTFMLLAVIQGVRCKTVKVETAEELEEHLRSQTTEKRIVKEDGRVVIKQKVKRPNRAQKKVLLANDVKDEARSSRNTEIRRIGIQQAILYLGLGAYLITFVALAPYNTNITENSYNLARVNAQSAKTVRGSIRTADGVDVAVTTVDGLGRESRQYPFGSLFCHFVGYTGAATSGIESLMNTKLLTSTKSISQQISSDLNSEKYVGDTVDISLVSTIQYTAYMAMGDYKGAVVVMDAETGDILAMVSKPDYDPNEIDDIWANIESYNNGESFLLNRATQGLYPPGSTFKVFTTLAYMRKYPITFDNYTYDCTGAITLGKTTIKCSDGHVHGNMTLTTGLEQSCNGTFANIGAQLSNEEFTDTINSLLFNSDLPYPLGYKKSSFAITSSSTAEERMLAAFGQGKTLVSPLHMCMLASAIVNDGVLMKPRLVRSITAVTGSKVEEYAPEAYGSLMSGAEAQWLKNAMLCVVKNGTPQAIYTDEYYSGGKTGSAQYGSSLEDLHAWYFGFGYKEGYHKLAVAIVLEGGGSGGQHAAPIAKTIFDFYFNANGA